MAGKKVGFELTSEERATLSMWVSSHKTQQRMSRRAQMILLSEEGWTLREISRQSGLSEKNRLKLRKRFIEYPVDGLKDAPRKGRPSVITPWQRTQVIRHACERPPSRAKAWSMRELARATGLDTTTIFGYLTKHPSNLIRFITGAVRALTGNLNPNSWILSVCIWLLQRTPRS